MHFRIGNFIEEYNEEEPSKSKFNDEFMPDYRKALKSICEVNPAIHLKLYDWNTYDQNKVRVWEKEFLKKTPKFLPFFSISPPTPLRQSTKPSNKCTTLSGTQKSSLIWPGTVAFDRCPFGSSNNLW